MQPESAAFLWDARAAGIRITTFTDGLTDESYAADELRKADPETAQRIPDISRIVGLRNILAHGYAVIDDTVVWSAVSERLPALLTVVENLLAEIE